MKKYDYEEVVKNIYNLFNNSFGTDYKIKYQSREDIESLNPDIKVGKSAGGFYDAKSKSIYIFSNVIDEINQRNYNNPSNENNNGLAFLIQACFHELEHRLQFDNRQKLRKQPSFSSVMYDIEKLIMICDKDFYKQKHDNFYLEIDADTKGVDNAINFVDFYRIDGVNKEYYEALRTYNQYRSLNYDIPQFVSRLNEIVKMYPNILNDERYINNQQILSFYDEKGNFKSIGEIMENQNILTPYIISSEMFLKGIDTKSITQEQRQFLIKNLSLVVTEHKSKKHLLKHMQSSTRIAIEKIDKYTHVSKTQSRRSAEFMFDEDYYQFLEGNLKSLSDVVIENDGQEL